MIFRVVWFSLLFWFAARSCRFFATIPRVGWGRLQPQDSATPVALVPFRQAWSVGLQAIAPRWTPVSTATAGLRGVKSGRSVLLTALSSWTWSSLFGFGPFD